MIRSPLSLRLTENVASDLRDVIRRAAKAGVRGIVLEATGVLAPDRLGETGRRDVRGMLRSLELSLVGVALPTRRPFDTLEQLEERVARIDRALAMAYEIGARMALIRLGPVPPAEAAERRPIFEHALGEIAARADHRGVMLAIEVGTDGGETLRGVLEAFRQPALGTSIDPAALCRMSIDPATVVRALAGWVAHAYANDGVWAGAARAGGTSVASPLDWEGYLGALEEIDYRGYLTVDPTPGIEPVAGFTAIANRLARY